MRAIWAVIFILLLRYVLLALFNKAALKRAALFPPLSGVEKPMYIVYQLCSAVLLIYPAFLPIASGTALFTTGLCVYAAGLLLLAGSLHNFAFPDHKGLNQRGLYRFSRNPMYVSYFLCFFGVAILAQSLPLFIILVLFQVSGHWMILAEERWCLEHFGGEYRQYMNTVRRYI